MNKTISRYRLGRMEKSMTCPFCGREGAMRGLRPTDEHPEWTPFRCEGYRYDPARQNECGFVIEVANVDSKRFR